jgi:hypothetical protein
MRKIFLLLAFIFSTVLVKSQFQPTFPQLINKPEFFNPGYYAIQHQPSVQAVWGTHFSHFINRNNAFEGLLAANANFPVQGWNASFGASLLAEVFGNYSKVNSTIHSGVKVQILQSSMLALGMGFGFENYDYEVYTSQEANVNITKFYSSAGLVFLSRSLELGTSFHFTPLHENGIFNGKNFSYFINGNYCVDLDEITELKPAFIFRFYNGTSLWETGISTRFNKKINIGLSYRFNNAFILYSYVDLFKRLTLGVAYFNNYKDFDYLSDGIYELCIKWRLGKF